MDPPEHNGFAPTRLWSIAWRCSLRSLTVSRTILITLYACMYPTRWHYKPNTTGCRHYLRWRGSHGKCVQTPWLGTQLYLWRVMWWFEPSYHFSDLKSSWQLGQPLLVHLVGMYVGLPHRLWTSLYPLLQILFGACGRYPISVSNHKPWFCVFSNLEQKIKGD